MDKLSVIFHLHHSTDLVHVTSSASNWFNMPAVISITTLLSLTYLHKVYMTLK